jgi:hypothetical protein
MAVELFFILFFGLGQLPNPENKIKKAGTNSPTRPFSGGARPKNKYDSNFVFIFKLFDITEN